MGLEVAFGPDNTAVYVQVGSARGRPEPLTEMTLLIRRTALVPNCRPLRWVLAVWLAALANPGVAGELTNVVTQSDSSASSSSTNLPSPAAWSFSASIYGYLVPEGRDYAQPTVAADRDWLHLEARYNYENLDTASMWAGYNLSGGKKLTWELTPMVGGVFGHTSGVAPGYSGSLNWWKLQLYSEGEYVFDLGDSSSSFFYNWSELSLSPVNWFRFGLVTQRTRVYQTDRDVQRGLLAGVSYRSLSFTTYVFNPDESKPVVVLAAAISF